MGGRFHSFRTVSWRRVTSALKRRSWSPLNFFILQTIPPLAGSYFARPSLQWALTCAVSLGQGTFKTTFVANIFLSKIDFSYWNYLIGNDEFIYLNSYFDIAIFVLLDCRKHIKRKIYVFSNSILHEFEGVIRRDKCNCSFFIKFWEPYTLMKFHIINAYAFTSFTFFSRMKCKFSDWKWDYLFGSLYINNLSFIPNLHSGIPDN